MTDVPRRASLTFILVAAALDVMAMGITIPVLPALIEEFSGSNAQAGVINGWFVALWAAMQLIASPILGSWSDQVGRRPVILLSCAGLAADYVLMALAPSLAWLAVGRVLAGVTSSSFTTLNAWLADVTPPEERSRAYGLIGAAFSAGFVLGPLLGGVLGVFGPRVPFWVAAALSACAFLYGWLVLPESLPPERRMAFAWRRANPFGALRMLSAVPALRGLASVHFLVFCAHYVFASVFVLYAGMRFDWGPLEVGTLLAAVGVLDVVVQAGVVGPLSARLGDRPTMILGLLGGVFGLAMMAAAPTGTWFTLAILPNALWGLAMPTLQSQMTRLVSEREQGQLQGATNTVGSIAGIFAPLVFGWVYAQSAGPDAWVLVPGAVFYLAAGVLAVAAALAATSARRMCCRPALTGTLWLRLPGPVHGHTSRPERYEMSRAMTRIQLHLTPDHQRRLDALARARHTTRAALIREGIDVLLRSGTSDDPLLALIGQAGGDGDGGVSANHDRILAAAKLVTP